MVVDESIGESSFQLTQQCLFYLVFVYTAVKVDGPHAHTRITFDSLVLSSAISIISLSRGQLKV